MNYLLFMIYLHYTRYLFILDNFFQSYKKLQQLITSLSFRETPRTKKFYRLVTTLRSENEKMLRLLSKKVTRLSMDFAQVRERKLFQISRKTLLNITLHPRKMRD